MRSEYREFNLTDAFILGYNAFPYPLMDLQVGQLNFFLCYWVKLVESKYPFIE